jgi:hypothetical protein
MSLNTIQKKGGVFLFFYESKEILKVFIGNINIKEFFFWKVKKETKNGRKSKSIHSA